MKPAFDAKCNVSPEDLIAEIRSAFHGVSREGGRSWTQCVALDCYCDMKKALELSGRPDDESHWDELVDDPRWDPYPGLGGFSFIDPIGFRYYLPPTMIRIVQGRTFEWCGNLIDDIERHQAGPLAPFDAAILKAIAMFVAFRANIEIGHYENKRSPTVYIDAFTTRWHKYLADSR